MLSPPIPVGITLFVLSLDSLDSTDYGQRIDRPRKRDGEGYQCMGIYHTFHSLKDASARTFVGRQGKDGGRKRKSGNVASWSWA